jgi:hypothetical protein
MRDVFSVMAMGAAIRDVMSYGTYATKVKIRSKWNPLRYLMRPEKVIHIPYRKILEAKCRPEK